MRRLLALAALVLVAGCAPSVVPPPTQPADTIEQPPPLVDPISDPEWIEIPRLDVSDEMIPVALNDDRTMATPPVDKIGWYSLGVQVGEVGPAVVPGHINWDGVPGSFARLGELVPGDRFIIGGDRVEQLTFEVYAVHVVPKNEFDMQLVYGDVDGPEVRLVTCSGAVVNRHYEDNTIISARLA